MGITPSQQAQCCASGTGSLTVGNTTVTCDKAQCATSMPTYCSANPTDPSCVKWDFGNRTTADKVACCNAGKCPADLCAPYMTAVNTAAAAPAASVFTPGLIFVIIMFVIVVIAVVIYIVKGKKSAVKQT